MTRGLEQIRTFGEALAAVDPASHEQTAAVVARLTALVEAQARTIHDHQAAMARSRDIFERASAAARLGCGNATSPARRCNGRPAPMICSISRATRRSGAITRSCVIRRLR
jgi:hypothetical protein